MRLARFRGLVSASRRAAAIKGLTECLIYLAQGTLRRFRIHALCARASGRPPWVRSRARGRRRSCADARDWWRWSLRYGGDARWARTAFPASASGSKGHAGKRRASIERATQAGVVRTTEVQKKYSTGLERRSRLGGGFPSAQDRVIHAATNPGSTWLRRF